MDRSGWVAQFQMAIYLFPWRKKTVQLKRVQRTNVEVTRNCLLFQERKDDVRDTEDR